MLNEEDRKYLANKHRGGVNNSKGNTYENRFAIFQIALLLRLYLDNYSQVTVSSQIPDSFVDDFLIVHPSGKLDFHQLKNVESKLTWETGSSQTIEYDFKKQKELLNLNGRNFSLHLVHSNIQADLTPIPVTIEACTQIYYFPYYVDLNRLILECSDFKDAMAKITGYSSPTIDQLVSNATILLGVWDSLQQDSVSLAYICQRISQLPLTGNNFIFDNVLKLRPEVIDILGRISDFSYKVEGSVFRWTYKQKLKGEVNSTEFVDFETAVLNIRPESFIDLQPLLF